MLVGGGERSWYKGIRILTSINLATDTENILANACTDYRAVLLLVVHDLIGATFNEFAGSLSPWSR